ncbi:riboflavin biosynthesis protein RibF [Caldimicrobium thiodismutans]|uniref:Riboflavin biosynthesis protein n=1 Tax=Caldimicrobium thiodismutans TaxID=1653476 RepID=A0A0U4W3C7_9BACT|nr:bifunctional riboflavin kinase/FAD synthetase [Caldimicrobium thiodismutans]BAU23595.1 riboflavin biosynthesis protein RibF [Caldimicrobium thiodismutans]
MEIYSPKDFPLPFDTAITIGAFDGIHLGHRALFQETFKISELKGLVPLVVTFNPHPRKVIQPHLELKLLTTLEEKLELLEREGFSRVVVLPFTKALAEITADLFVEKYLVDYLRAKAVVIGFNFRFGRSRTGDTELLKNLGQKYGFQVTEVPPVKLEDKTISSTLIRETLKKGEVEKASKMLGRNYTLIGKVISGKGRGKKLGFPTANLLIPSEKLIPAQGVYAVWVYLDFQRFPGALNIGYNPTFDEKELSIEVHILDLNGDMDLYNQALKVEFVKFIRGEKKFSSIEELIQQISQDCQLIRKVLI